MHSVKEELIIGVPGHYCLSNNVASQIGKGDIRSGQGDFDTDRHLGIGTQAKGGWRPAHARMIFRLMIVNHLVTLEALHDEGHRTGRETGHPNDIRPGH